VTVLPSLTVSLISEGVLPTSIGGVGRWLNYLINGLTDFSFNLMVIGGPEKYGYEKINRYESLSLEDLEETGKVDPTALESLLKTFLDDDENPLLHLEEAVEWYRSCPSTKSRAFWKVLTNFYQEHFLGRSYAKFFLTVRSLLSPMLSILRRKTPLEGDVYCALNAGYAGFAGVLMKALTGKPLLVTVHGIYEDEREWELRSMGEESWVTRLCLNFFKRMSEVVYEKADKIITVNEANRRRLIELGAPKDRVETIKNPVNTDVFKPTSKKTGDKIVVGTVIRIVPVKGLKDFILAAKRLTEKAPNLRFIVVGPVQDRRYFQRCIELVERLNLSGSIEFVGEDDPTKWYPKFDVFVLPSLMECASMAVLEAMASGLPVVCTETAGTREMVGKYWPLTPPGDPEKLAERIYEVITSLDECRSKALKVAGEVAKRHSLKTFTERYFTTFMDLKSLGFNETQEA